MKRNISFGVLVQLKDEVGIDYGGVAELKLCYCNLNQGDGDQHMWLWKGFTVILVHVLPITQPLEPTCVGCFSFQFRCANTGMVNSWLVVYLLKWTLSHMPMPR